MQKLIFFLVILLTGNIAYSQVCIPDTTLIPENSLIFPVPYQDTVPGSGITQVACINTPYELIFHANVPELVQFLGFNVNVISVELVSIDNLPEGLQYACEPSTCFMPKNTAGCVTITGTPTESNTPGIYPIVLNFQFTTQQFGTLTLSFPDANVAPGTYEIELLGASAECSNAVPVIPGLSNFNAVFDRRSGNLFINFASTEMNKGIYRIFDMSGRMIESFPLQINNGPNEIVSNLSHLPDGVYLYRMDVGGTYQTGKMVK